MDLHVGKQTAYTVYRGPVVASGDVSLVVQRNLASPDTGRSDVPGKPGPSEI